VFGAQLDLIGAKYQQKVDYIECEKVYTDEKEPE
jgi:hypothetical protein